MGKNTPPLAPPLCATGMAGLIDFRGIHSLTGSSEDSVDSTEAQSATDDG